MKTKLLSLLMFMMVGVASGQINITEPDSLEVCSTGNFAQFNLAVQTAVVLEGLTPANYTVTYHEVLASANGDLGAIANPESYTNVTNPQTMFMRIEENANADNFEISDFVIAVNPIPNIFAQEYVACDWDNFPNDGMTMVDLYSVSEQLWFSNDISPGDMEIIYYLTQADAQNQVNALTSPFQTSSANQVIFARATYYATGCSKIIVMGLATQNCAELCLTPNNLVVTQISSGSATIAWNQVGGENQWEVAILPVPGPGVTPETQGIITTTNPFVLTGLACPQNYRVHVRSVCDGQVSSWSVAYMFATNECINSSVETENLVACAENGSACFDLTVNDDNVLINLNPNDYAVTYHLSADAAEAGVSPLSNAMAYCTDVSGGSDEIFIRLMNLDTNEFQVFWFTVTAQEILNGETLDPLVGCDEDGDTIVYFDLTTAEAQLNTDNDLQYYENDGDAFAGQNPIDNPQQFWVSTTNSLVTVYVRESLPGACDIIYAWQLNATSDCELSNVCVGAHSLCNAFGVPFSNATNIAGAEPGNDYGCLNNTPNPIWFYLPISGPGAISLKIEQSSTINFQQANLDVDFIMYGPYSDPVTPCSGLLTDSYIVDCSYSTSPIEYPFIPNAQAGQYYLIMVTNYFNQPGYIRITETAESVGEIDCLGLRLNAFLDANANTVKDSNEVNFSLGQFQYELNNDEVIHNITSPSGVHRIYDSNTNNSYDVSYTINPEYASYYSVTTPLYSDVNITDGGGLQQIDFAITSTQPYNDVSVNIIPNNAPRPGFTYTNTIAYTNHGNQAANGTVIFHIDPMVSIVSNSQSGTVPTATGFTYTYSNLQPYETRMMHVTMLVPTIPTVALGDMLASTAEITPLEGDVMPANNSSESVQTIIGSYDPNDKMESRGPQILISEFSEDDYFYYTIRFENTGTASAINVRITDILDSNLDPTSVRMVRASHDYVLDRVGSELTWRFDNIMLPATIEDADASNGYVHFMVKPLPDYAIGDMIPNTASIYFDFNPAIVTNTFESTFVSQLAVNEFENGNFVFYPNPTHDVVTVSVKNNEDRISAIAVYDMLGKTILVKKSSMASETIDLSEAAKGLYMIEITTNNNMKVVKKLIVN